MKKGKVLSKGVGYGYVHNFEYSNDVKEYKEITLQEVLDSVKKDLTYAYESMGTLSEEEAMIFEAHKTLLEDCTFIEGIENYVAEGMSLAQAIMENGKKSAVMFLNMEDNSLRHIAEDIMDITYQMLDVLNDSTSENKIKEPVVLYCENIFPSNLREFISSYKVAAVITKDTADGSHTAILANDAGIPMITGIDIELKNKMPIIVDANENSIILNPDYEQLLRLNIYPYK